MQFLQKRRTTSVDAISMACVVLKAEISDDVVCMEEESNGEKYKEKAMAVMLFLWQECTKMP